MHRFSVYCLKYNKDSYVQNFHELKPASMFAEMVKDKYDAILVIDKINNILFFRYEEEIE